MKYSVIGGDMRSRYLRGLLAAEGHFVRSYGLGEETDEKSLTAALEGAEAVVLPLPMLNAAGNINAPFCEKTLSLSDIAPLLPPDALVLGGNINVEVPFPITDYFRREELTVRNAAITAEGAIGILMRELPIAVSDMSVVIVGTGRIGKLLAGKLRALGAGVTLTARREGDLALARELGCDWCHTDKLRFAVKNADAVVNTVPARVIDGAVLRAMKQEGILLDLASKPFGYDADEAAALGVKAVLASGLPGKAAPKSAAMAVRDTIYNIVNERECSD